MITHSLKHIYIFFSLIITAFAGVLFFLFHNHCVDLSRLERYNPGRPTIVLDDQGNEWARFQLDRREPIMLNKMPDHLIHAFVAAEDWHFFSHNGISWRGVIRSIAVNLYRGKKAQGASTITQQLVRLLFFDSGKTYSRKLKEQLYALLVEQQFTKEYILQTYLNHIYFGCGIYGVQAASQRFWGKDAAKLESHESATLAAIICSPNRYCPLLYPLSAQRRRNIILGSMYKLGYLTQDVYEQACAIPVTTIEKKSMTCAPHLKEALRIQLEDLVGKKALYSDGLVVQTTINSSMQQYAERAFTRHVQRLREERSMPFDGGFIAMDTETGDIKAYVGGFDFNDSKFDRVAGARRQIGSIFKCALYASAVEQDMSFAQTAVDEQVELDQGNSVWRPQNHTRTFEGEVTHAYALSRSNNSVSVKILLALGADRVIEMAKRCHLSGPYHTYPSLALGCLDVPLIEAAGLFNIFAINGKYVQPTYLVWVKDKWGCKIYKRKPVVQEQVMSPRISGQVTKVLSLGVDRLRRRFPKQWIDSDAISKTGTTNGWRTCWFMGSTPTLTAGIYIGCDDNRSMGVNTYPVHTGFPIWLDFNRMVKHTKKNFVYDPSLKEVTIHERTGKPVRSDHPQAITIFV